MATKKFRVLVVNPECSEPFFSYRSSVHSCMCYVKNCILSLYPVHGLVSYYIQEFDSSLNDYVTLISCVYNYSDLPF